MKKILIVTLTLVSSISLYGTLGDIISEPVGFAADITEDITGPIPVVGEAGYVAGETARTAGNIAGDIVDRPFYYGERYPARTREESPFYRRDVNDRPVRFYKR
jgi:hypothetical protein